MGPAGKQQHPALEPPPFQPQTGPIDNSCEAAAKVAWDIPSRYRTSRQPSLAVQTWISTKQLWSRFLQEKKIDDGDESVWTDLLEEAPAWLVSVLVHAGLVLFVGICAVGVQQHIVKNMEVDVATASDYSAEVFAESLGSQLQQPMPGQLLNEFDPLLDPSYSLSELPAVGDPLAGPAVSTDIAQDGSSLLTAIERPSIGLALKGRQEGYKEALLAAYGGTRTTQDSVAQALNWLARQQRHNGLWSLQGPYKDGSTRENQLSATAMALLAFLGDGKTHVAESPYRRNVQRAVKALMKLQGHDGEFYTEETLNNHRLYTHAQCTIAFCELYGMTQDSYVRDAAERAVSYCVEIQSQQGGWRYFPGEDADMSVTGWFVMALQSARMAKLEVPQDTLYRVDTFLDSVADEQQVRYSYVPQQVPTVTMTAEAILCRQYLGWKKNDRRLLAGIEYLNDNPVDWAKHDVYYWYYATQVLHHMGGEHWVRWNKNMRQVVPENQIRDGRERGSWDPFDDRWGTMVGRLYTTCLSTYMLEVYYRHLPLYGMNTSKD